VNQMYQNFFKRLFDLALAALALPLWLLILAMLGPCIYFQDRGSIFFNAPRLGKNGQIFKMYKFRSMRINAPDIRNPDGSTFNSEDDPRVTKLGRFLRKSSLDETPQILNILKGEMSFIGPRPDLPEEIEHYYGPKQKILTVLPGITGYNQAYYRNKINLERKVENDIYYVENISLNLDVKVFFKTIQTVMHGRNIYRN
jgi:lipopolysaccharide/colanic/teichoic acid biosynthesis glycosyltransferase